MRGSQFRQFMFTRKRADPCCGCGDATLWGLEQLIRETRKKGCAMPRPSWEGHLQLSLVTCPVALYSAIDTRGDVHFHLVHKRTHRRINMVPKEPELGEVERSDLVRAFEVAKDRYVILSDDEIDKVRLPSTKIIAIERFVDVGDIDRIYWHRPYYLVPSGKVGIDAFVIIRAAMEQIGRIALGRLVLAQRERLVALEPRGKAVLLTTLRSHDDIRSATSILGDIPATKPDKAMLEIARKIVEQQSGPFDPSEFKDRYEDALRDLIAMKKKGKAAARPDPEPESTNVVDLMAALRKSLGNDGPRRQRAERFIAAARTKSRRSSTTRPKRTRSVKRARAS